MTPTAQATPRVDRQYRWLTAAIAMLALFFSIAPGGLVWDPVMREAMDEAGTGGSFRLMWLPLILLSMTVLALRFRWLLWMGRDLNAWLLLLLAWCLASALWAPNGGTAFRQAFAVAGVAFCAYAFVSSAWYPGRWGVVMMPTMAALAVASVAVAIVRPDIGIHSSTQFELMGSWRGITYQKNGLGQLSAVTLIFFAHAWVTGTLRTRYAVAGALLAVFLLLKSRSSTSLMLSIISCLLLFAVLRPPISMRGSKLVLGLASFLLLGIPLYLYIIAMGGLDYHALATPFAEIFGKDATFSGRTDIWALVWEQIKQHPWFGIGFNSFWGKEGSASDGIVQALGWSVPNAHSGYLDMVNDVGLIGFVLFVGFLVQHGRALAQLGRFDRGQFGLHLALIVYLCLANLSESGWFRPISLVHVLAMFSSAEVSRRLVEQRLLELGGATPANDATSAWPQRSSAAM